MSRSAVALVASLLLLTVAVSALSSTQTTILPTARGSLSMAVYEAIPKRFAYVHPRYMTPAFGTIVMGIIALGFYLVLSFISQNALADSIASLGLAVAFYYGITAYACVGYFRRSLFDSARNFFMRGLFSVVGCPRHDMGVRAERDRHDPARLRLHRFGSIGGVFVLGVGMLALGIPLMLLCFAFGTKNFFAGRTLTPETKVKVPDVY